MKFGKLKSGVNPHISSMTREDGLQDFSPTQVAACEVCLELWFFKVHCTKK